MITIQTVLELLLFLVKMCTSLLLLINAARSLDDRRRGEKDKDRKPPGT